MRYCAYFASLSDTFYKLKTLEIINIEECPNLRYLPEHIANLTNLKELNIEIDVDDYFDEYNIHFSIKIPKSIAFCNLLRTITVPMHTILPPSLLLLPMLLDVYINFSKQDIYKLRNDWKFQLTR